MEEPRSCCVVVRGAGSECCGPAASDSFARRYVTADERRKKLEEYREELKKELAGVEERLEELKRAK